MRGVGMCRALKRSNVKKQIVSTLLVAVMAASSGLAYAQPDRGPGGPGGPGSPGNGPGNSHGNGHDDAPGKGPNHGQNKGPGKGPNYGPGQGPGHDAGRGPGPKHGHGYDRPDPAPSRWSKGERVPQPYRGPQYVINDWRGYHLKQPPRGYQWISVGADYFLIGVATGIVLESVFDR
jgi:Ni/Co efflux regulator RcnB